MLRRSGQRGGTSPHGRIVGISTVRQKLCHYLCQTNHRCSEQLCSQFMAPLASCNQCLHMPNAAVGSPSMLGRFPSRSAATALVALHAYLIAGFRLGLELGMMLKV